MKLISDDSKNSIWFELEWFVNSLLKDEQISWISQDVPKGGEEDAVQRQRSQARGFQFEWIPRKDKTDATLTLWLYSVDGGEDRNPQKSRFHPDNDHWIRGPIQQQRCLQIFGRLQTFFVGTSCGGCRTALMVFWKQRFDRPLTTRKNPSMGPRRMATT
ncbi:uncharacterized protein FTOL_03867 [Fusarium torulosum]|uniref:Uncharacterized protein n=1 Tax=Fusarium torulosum TaxID=33205 RepID=A0AAE8M4Q2_9HYPO|nr:uncharacterized protein FTOL_03867 [Fusarium torulosum]